MNEIQEIEVVIGADGQVEVDIVGAKGPQCLTFTKEMEALLGGQVSRRELTPEYDEQPASARDAHWLKPGD